VFANTVILLNKLGISSHFREIKFCSSTVFKNGFVFANTASSSKLGHGASLQSKSSDLNTFLPPVPSLGHKREMVLAQCHVHHEKFASEAILLASVPQHLFHKIAQTK
jgi:hypothetical protein